MAEIYALTDPRTGDVRYIGKAAGRGTRFDRYGWHIRDACYETNLSPKAIWLRELFAEGLVPGLLLLETCGADALHRETEWFAWGRSAGWSLTNQQGNGYTHSDETRSAISEANVGRTYDDEARANMSAGQFRRDPPTAETRAKMRESATGRQVSDETREKLRQSAHRRWGTTPE